MLQKPGADMATQCRLPSTRPILFCKRTIIAEKAAKDDEEGFEGAGDTWRLFVRFTYPARVGVREDPVPDAPVRGGANSERRRQLP